MGTHTPSPPAFGIPRSSADQANEEWERITRIENIEAEIGHLYNQLQDIVNQQNDQEDAAGRIWEIPSNPRSNMVSIDRKGRAILPDARATHWDAWARHTLQADKRQCPRIERKADQVAEWALKAAGKPAYDKEEAEYWANLVKKEPTTKTRLQFQKDATNSLLLYTATWLMEMETQKRKLEDRQWDKGLPKASTWLPTEPCTPTRCYRPSLHLASRDEED